MIHCLYDDASTFFCSSHSGALPMSDFVTREPRPIKILDFVRLQLFTPAPNMQNVRSKLSFGFRDGNPRITVFTNDPNDTIAKGIIYAGLSPEMFEIFLMVFDSVIKAKEETKQAIDCYTTRYEDNKSTGERILNSQIWIGKDANQLIWMTLTAENRPRIRFTFQISEWHKVYRHDGSPISEAEGSALAAMAHLSLLRQVYGVLLSNYLLNPPPVEARTVTLPASGKRPNGFESDSSSKSAGLMFDDDTPF
jgi:hypothetical protein